MSFMIETTTGERYNRHIHILRKALRVACIQAVSASLMVGVLTYQAQTAKLGLYTHPLESAIRAAGVQGIPQVNAIVWTGFQPSVPPNMGELKGRAQAVLFAFAPGHGAVLHSTSDNVASVVQYTGKKGQDTTFKITARYEKPRYSKLPGAILVTLEIEGSQASELRGLENEWRRAVQHGALHPWSKVDTWLTLSGKVKNQTSSSTGYKAMSAGGGTDTAISVQLDKGILQRGYSPLLSPAWRLGDQLTNIEIRVETINSTNGDTWVQVGSPFVMAVKRGKLTSGTTIARINAAQG